MKNIVSTAWHWLIDWFEHGDLVPLLVLVSAVHYASVLQDKDNPVVAVAIGLLVDLGHYRTVRAAVRYAAPGAKNKRRHWRVWRLRISYPRWSGQAVARWLIAAGMTALSLNYHQRYYGDWWLSAPLPLLIAALAWLQKVDQRIGSKPKAEPSEARVARSEPASKPAPLHVCSCGYVARSANALNAHQRKHVVKIPLNGKAN